MSRSPDESDDSDKITHFNWFYLHTRSDLSDSSEPSDSSDRSESPFSKIISFSQLYLSVPQAENHSFTEHYTVYERYSNTLKTV